MADGYIPVSGATLTGNSATVRLLPAFGYQIRYVSEGQALGYAFDMQSGTHALGSDRLRPFRRMPNSLSALAPGCDVFSESARGGEYLVAEMKGAAKVAIDLPPGDHFFDPAAASAANVLRQMILSGIAFDAVMVDRHVDCMIDAFKCGGSPRTRAAQPSMTERRSRLIEAYVEECLANQLTVQMIADMLALSPSFLARSFRASHGMSVYNYVIDRRLARARWLLGHEPSSIVDIAQATGFSSQAHLTTSFRLRFGLTPARYRSLHVEHAHRCSNRLT